MFPSTRTRRPMKRSPMSRRPTVKCKACGEFFLTWPYRIRDGVRACSMKCKGILGRKQKSLLCAECGQEYSRCFSQVFYRGAKYCSKYCQYKGQVARAAAAPITDQWGRTKRKADRIWQEAVRERDAYTCRRCGKQGSEIAAHHVNPRSQRPDLKHDVSNGICLCGICHGWVHMHPVEAKALGLLNVSDTYELVRATGWRVDNALMTYKGKTLYMAEWARRLNCDRGALEARRKRGWPDARIIETPVRHTPPRTMITYHGRTMGISDWSHEIGISVVTLRARINAGWTTERLIETRPIPPKLRRANVHA